MYDIFSLKEYTFPEGFLWGSGYAGHQVEGNNIHSDRYVWELETQEEQSGMACNSYALFEEDIALAERLGHRAFRTSVEWSRIEPEEGIFCQEAVDHYVALFSKLREKGIKTFATLVHFSVPFRQSNRGTTVPETEYFSVLFVSSLAIRQYCCVLRLPKRKKSSHFRSKIFGKQRFSAARRPIEVY